MQILLKAVLSALIILFFAKLSTFAMSHSATYEMDGVITFGTGNSTQSQTTSGQKSMTKTSANISSGVIDIMPNDYVQGEARIANVAAIDLCAPPKYTYEAEDGSIVEINPDFVFKRSGYTGSQESLEKTTLTWNSLF